MSLINNIILTIINSITFFLGISNLNHNYIYKNIFNTKIFNNENLINFLYLPFIITIIIYHRKTFIALIKPSFKKKKHYYLKYILNILIVSIINTLVYFFIPKIKLNIKNISLSYIILSLIIYLSINKKGIKKYNEITYIDSIFIGLSPILSYIPTIHPFISNLFISKLRKLDKKNSLTISLLTIIPILTIKLIPSIPFILYNENLRLISIIIFIISIIISLKTLKYFKQLYIKDKLLKLSFYCLALSIFIKYWFR